MATVDEAFKNLANLNLWFKVRTGEDLMLSDLPEIIPLRWTYVRNNWQFIKSVLQGRVPSYMNPDFLNEQINDFGTFVESQRNVTKKINPFSDGNVLNQFYAVFDNIPINSVNLTNEEERIMSAKIDEIKRFSKNNFLDIKQSIINYRDRFADTIGLSDEDYNKAFGKNSIPPQLNATIVDVNMMLVLQNGVKTVDFILANLFAVDAFIDPFALARSNANNPDIDIGQYSSGSLVKLNYGESLQDLAARYFGNPDKWIDIAIANGLKPPYIDEVGTRLLLLSNGNGNQINIAEVDLSGNLNIDKFYINQAIFLQSDTAVFPEQRTITSIRQIPVSGEIILELDGLGDLDKYKVSESAHVRVYKPNTVNSAFYVLIPSTEPLPDTRRDEVPWFMAKSPETERRAKIDLAIDDKGEINFGTNGDIKLSFGLANAIQAIKLKMMTELNSLRYHPDYGLVNVLGNKNDDLNSTKALLVESITSQIESDSRYDRVENISVDEVITNTETAAKALLVNLSVRLAGSRQVIPISFTVNF